MKKIYIYIYIYTYFPPEPVKTAKRSLQSISEGGMTWQKKEGAGAQREPTRDS